MNRSSRQHTLEFSTAKTSDNKMEHFTYPFLSSDCYCYCYCCISTYLLLSSHLLLIVMKLCSWHEQRKLYIITLCEPTHSVEVYLSARFAAAVVVVIEISVFPSISVHCSCWEHDDLPNGEGKIKTRWKRIRKCDLQVRGIQMKNELNLYGHYIKLT